MSDLRTPRSESNVTRAQANDSVRFLLALCLGLTLFGLYFLTYSGRLESSDSVSLYAVTESIAKRGELDTGPFIWDRWTAGYQDAQGDFGVDGEIYSKKGLGTSVSAAPLTWLALRIPEIGLLQTTYLFNLFITALTAVILFFYVQRLGYDRDVGLLVGGLFGVATLAWPYANYFYSEPLMGLLLILAAYFLLLFVQEHELIWLAGGGLALGWAAVTRLTNLVVLPIYFVYALGPPLWAWLKSYRQPARQKRGELKTWLQYAIVLALSTGLALIVIVLYNYVRFGTPLRSGYAQTAGFWTPLWEGLYGYFISPQKSLFLFAPVLLLPVLSIPLFLHRHLREGLFLLVLFALPAGVFAKWMDWEGGLAWGPRYLVALVPLLMPFSATGLAWLLGRWPFAPQTKRWTVLRYVLLALLALLALWSIATQLLAASVNVVHYLRIPRALATAWHGSPWALSPPLLPWVFSPGIIEPDLLDLAWFRALPGDGIVIAWAPLLATAIFTLAAGAALLWTRTHRPTGRATALFTGMAILAVTLLAGFNLRCYSNDPNRGAGDDYMELVAYLSAHEAPGDALLVSSHVYMGFFMNYSKTHMKWYSLLSKEDEPTPDEVVLLEHVVARHPRIWLAIDRIAELNLPRPTEKWLSAHAYKLDERTFSAYSRLCLYATAAAPDAHSAQHELAIDLGHGIRLSGYDLYPTDTHWTGGDVLRLSLLWEASGIPDGNYALFVQLIDNEGKLVWQTDHVPGAGFAPTFTWLPGERIRDNTGLIVPEEWPAGEYRLIAGMYDPASGERLPMKDANGMEIGDYVLLSEISYATAKR